MRLIDADEFFKNFPELAIEPYINAPTVDTDEIYKKGYHNGFFATHDVPPTIEPTYISDMPDDKVKDLQELAIDYGEGIAVFERKRPQGDLADEVWKLYEKYHSHLATHVIEFGDELKDLLGKYKKGGAV